MSLTLHNPQILRYVQLYGLFYHDQSFRYLSMINHQKLSTFSHIFAILTRPLPTLTVSSSIPPVSTLRYLTTTHFYAWPCVHLPCSFCSLCLGAHSVCLVPLPPFGYSLKLTNVLAFSRVFVSFLGLHGAHGSSGEHVAVEASERTSPGLSPPADHSLSSFP